MKPRVLVTRKILPEALAFIESQADMEVGTLGGDLPKSEFIRKVKDKDGVLTLLLDTVDREVMDAAPSLKIIANCAVGFNNIDIPYAREKGIWVTNTPDVLTEATADLTVALILAAARRIPESERYLREGKFHGWGIDLFLGKEMAGRRLGIIGLGRIGKAVARRALGFGLEVVYFDPNPLPSQDEARLRLKYLPLADLLQTSDIVTIHASLTPESRHLISGKQLSLMKKDAILINVARGPIVDESALADALEKGGIWGAGLDVYENEPLVEERLLRLPNVVLLPHIGSATYETRLRMSMTAARNLIQGARGEKPDNLVLT